MKVLGVITARGGSVRLPNKNIKMLGGKPLIVWSIEVGLKTCNTLVTSTDSTEIADVAYRYGSEVIMRPPELCGDANHLDIVVHAAKEAAKKFGDFNVVLLLQPTSPFRTVDDVTGAIKKMEETGAESVVSMVFKSDYNSYSLGHSDRIRPQGETEARWAMNGAVYLITWVHLMNGGDWEGAHAYAYRMPMERSLDIDTHSDFDAAVAMLNNPTQFALDAKLIDPIYREVGPYKG